MILTPEFYDTRHMTSLATYMQYIRLDPSRKTYTLKLVIRRVLSGCNHTLMVVLIETAVLPSFSLEVLRPSRENGKTTVPKSDLKTVG
jgi:hypothetical protein